jgi:competence protein ComEC
VGWLAVGIMLGVAGGAVSAAARTSARDADPLATLAHDRRTAQVEVTVVDDPRQVRSTRVGPPTYLVPARLTLLRTDEGTTRLDARILVFATDESWRSLLPSQRVAATARLAPAGGGDLTAAVLTATGTPDPLDHPSWTQTAAGVLRAGLQAACRPLPQEPGGLLPGLVIGDTSRLDPAVAEEFRVTGLTHLVAVSGANVAIVLGVVLFAARWCRAGPWLAAGVCGVALVGFVILARPSPSVVRAAAMGAVGLLALASGRSRSAAPALAAAVMAGVIFDPDLAVDPGFVLSVLATGGLVLLAPRWRDRLRDRGVPPVLAEALAVSAAAQVVCGPVVAALSGEVSLVAVPANLLAVPAVAPATLLGVAAAVVSPLWPEAASFLAWLGSWPARWLVWVADVGAGVPAGAVPWPAGVAGGFALAVLTVGMLIAARWPVPRRVLLVAAVAVALGAAPVRWIASGWPPAGAVVVACDVGQGDAIVLPVRPGEAVLVDAGPDPAAVDGCLRRLGIRSLVALVVTHFHVDHIGGVLGVVRDRSVGVVVVPVFDEPEAGEAALREAAGGTPVVEVGAGWRLQAGDLDLAVIGPNRPVTGTRSDPNNNSLIVRASSAGVSVLLVGDAETEQQHALLTEVDRGSLRAQVLKVAHHGSAYQDPDLLAAVDPAVALVSVGADNPYGHPNPSLMSRLSRDGARVVRTDLDGDIAVVAGPNGLAVAVRGAAG